MPDRGRRPGGETAATEMLDKLIKLGEKDSVQLLRVFDVALEYKDNPQLRGKSLPAGQRLLMQLEFAYEEVVGDK